MIPEIGEFALILALFVALTQAVVPMLGARVGNVRWMAVGQSAATALFALIATAFACLMWCYVTSDFSVLNVVQNSHTAKPLLYKVAGLWGNHEGSMLLWVLILSLYGFLFALFSNAVPVTLRARALAVQGFTACGFLLFILLTSNPFARVDPAPINGEGLNPLLQDPGLAFHPPFLYLGYVGFSMAFSLAIAALIEGRVDAVWARLVRPWALLAWCFLTFGIAMGSWWAYYTLGWGGWWYWDPVENASFMPWLAGTALLHSLMVVERRNTLKSWSVLLTLIAFSFSLLGTFLVRSGALTSVHSFASDPERGVFILAMFVVFTGGSFVLFALRAPQMSRGTPFEPVSRESALLLNNVLLSVAAATVLLGTLYPLFIDALGLGKISVGPPYFNAVFAPLMVPLIVVMAIGPDLTWRSASLKAALRRFSFAGCLALLAFIVTLGLKHKGTESLLPACAIALATWLTAGSLTTLGVRLRKSGGANTSWTSRLLLFPRRLYGMSLAHIGLAVVLAGITGSTAWKTEKIQVMHIGQTVSVAGYDVTLKNVDDTIRGPNYLASRATFIATRQGAFIAYLLPEKRLYDVPRRPTTNAAIHTNLLGDLYAVVGDADDTGGYVTRLYYNPLVPWIFLGAALMALGGFVSLTDRGLPMSKAEVPQ